MRPSTLEVKDDEEGSTFLIDQDTPVPPAQTRMFSAGDGRVRTISNENKELSMRTARNFEAQSEGGRGRRVLGDIYGLADTDLQGGADTKLGDADRSGLVKELGLEEEQKLAFVRRIPSMKVEILKAELRRRGLDEKGKKQDLSLRLEAAVMSAPSLPVAAHQGGTTGAVGKAAAAAGVAAGAPVEAGVELGGGGRGGVAVACGRGKGEADGSGEEQGLKKHDHTRITQEEKKNQEKKTWNAGEGWAGLDLENERRRLEEDIIKEDIIKDDQWEGIARFTEEMQALEEGGGKLLWGGGGDEESERRAVQAAKHADPRVPEDNIKLAGVQLKASYTSSLRPHTLVA
jgi:hypothetical protein